MKKHLFPLLLLCLFSHTAYAQDDTEWFWALRENGELIAYSTDSDVNTLIVGGVGSVEGYRINSQRALVIVFMQDDDQLYFYELTPTTAELQVYSWDATELILPIENPQRRNFFSYGHIATLSAPFAAVRFNPYSSDELGVSVLINLDANSVERLASGAQYFTFSEDGSELFYSILSQDYRTEFLAERNLLTGATTLQDPSTVPTATPSSAIRSLLEQYECEYTTFEEIQRICGLLIGEFDEYVTITRTICHTDCELHFHPPNSEDTLTFLVPDPYLVPRFWLRGQRLFASTHSQLEYWILAPNTPPQRIGFQAWCSHAYPTPHSPDQRWWIMRTGDYSTNTFVVWDRESESFVFERPNDGCVGINYFEEGFIITNFAADMNFFYRASDQNIIEFSDRYSCYHVVNETEFLCSTTLDLFSNIYSYDLRTGIYLPLVANIRQIHLRDAR